MDLVLADRVPIQVANGANLIGLSVELDLITFHSFLNNSTNFVQSRVNSSIFDTSVCGVLDGFQKSIVFRIKGDSKSRVDNSAVHVCSKINLANVIVL